MNDITHVHEFVGRLDRWCEVCNRPDRHPIHATLRVLAQRRAIRAKRESVSPTNRMGS